MSNPAADAKRIVQTHMFGARDDAGVSGDEARSPAVGPGIRHRSGMTPPGAVLAQMFEEITAAVSDDWRAFRALVHILGDATRLHPLDPHLRSIADTISPLFSPFVAALENEDLPFDPLGEVFAHFEVADKDSAGQVLTPRWICEYINDATVGRALQEVASGDREMDCPMIVLDPAAGTGRFPIDLAQRYGNLHQDTHPITIYAVEKNIWLYRACLVNLRLLAFGQPALVLWGDSLLLDLSPGSPNWLAANLWHPVDWRELVPMRLGRDDAGCELQTSSLACGGPEPAPTEYVSLDAWEGRTSPAISLARTRRGDG